MILDYAFGLIITNTHCGGHPDHAATRCLWQAVRQALLTR